MRKHMLAIVMAGASLTLGGADSLFAFQEGSRGEVAIRALAEALRSDTDVEVRRAAGNGGVGLGGN
jgi:hypothetical protein